MTRCNLCDGTDLISLINFGEHPIAHDYLRVADQVEYLHPLHLFACNRCGLIFLIDPIPADRLYQDYFTLSSWKHQPHIPRFIEMIEEFTDSDKTSLILEVGSNDGRFLGHLAEQGYRNLVGIEPTNDACTASRNLGINTIQAFFTGESARQFVDEHGKCNLFISRQMLEHVGNLKGFISCVKQVLIPGGFAIIEIPNFLCNLNTLDYAVWEEHINYFTLDTVRQLLENGGFKVIHHELTLFSGEALTLVAQYSGEKNNGESFSYMDSLRHKILSFRDTWPIFKRALVDYLLNQKENGAKIAIYGAGARLCSLVNFTGIGPLVEFIVDDQIEKQGLYLPGSRLPIIPSDALDQHSIDICLLAVNTECEEQVRLRHRHFLARGGKFVSVLPPSNFLPEFWQELIQEHNRTTDGT